MHLPTFSARRLFVTVAIALSVVLAAAMWLATTAFPATGRDGPRTACPVARLDPFELGRAVDRSHGDRC